MTTKARKVRAQVLQEGVANLTHATTETTSATWTPQRDVTIIGFELMCNAGLAAAEIAEAGGYEVVAELTQEAAVNGTTALGRVHQSAVWEAGADQHDLDTTEVTMFPEGYGVDLDDGESINLVGSAFNSQAASDAADYYWRCIIYYVDR